MTSIDRISDLSDMATQQEQTFLDAALSVRKPTGPKPCGRCLNCDEPLDYPERWCDEDCRFDWERRKGIGQ